MNQIFVHQFTLLVKQIKAEYLNAQMDGNLKEANMHKYRLQNVKRILNTIKKLDFEIESASDVEDIPGLGKGTMRRINEILKIGKLSEIEQKFSDKKYQKIVDIQELTKIIGIGDKFAQKLVTDYKITSIDKLKEASDLHTIELSDQIILGLKYHNIVQGNIPRKEIVAVEKYLKIEAHKLDPQLELIICGSYRRGTPTSGDIDVLLYHTDIRTSKQIKHPSYLESLIDSLTDDNFILDNLTDKNYKIKYMGFSKYKQNPVRRIDIRFIPFNSIHTAQLYFTGPAELNTEMRKQAIKRHMTLNEYGLYLEDTQTGLKQLKVNSEADVFKLIGMEYLTPIEREKYASGKKN